jgi:hypothetical protein
MVVAQAIIDLTHEFDGPMQMALEVYTTFGDADPATGQFSVVTGLNPGHCFNEATACTDVVTLKDKPLKVVQKLRTALDELEQAFTTKPETTLSPHSSDETGFLSASGPVL